MTTADTTTCSHPRCHPDSGCAKGERVHECSHFLKNKDEETAVPTGACDGEGVPWTGSAFGLDDITWLASRQRPLLFAPIGAHNAGKSTYLASLYIGLCRGVLPAQHRFTGSFTYGGWEKLAAYVRHAPHGIGPGFPPHTPVTENRLPGWLHLGFRSASGEVRDVLLADTPGEWFSRWAMRPVDDGASGARWISRHADGFLFFVDSAGLVGPDRRIVADKMEFLAQRLAGILAGRPVVIVWAKADQEVRGELRSDVEASLDNAFPGAMVFQTSVYSGPDNEEPTRPFWNPIEWLLLREVPVSPLEIPSPLNPADAFLAFRG